MKKLFAFSLLISLYATSLNVFAQKQIGRTLKTEKSSTTQTIIQKSAAPVETGLQGVQALSEGNGVFIKWQTSSEKDLVGFNVYRFDGKANVRVNENLIISSNLSKGQTFGNTGSYNFFDNAGAFANSYSIESVYAGNRTVLNNPVMPVFTSDLKSASDGLSAENLRPADPQNQIVTTSKNSDSKFTSDALGRTSEMLADPETQKWVEAQPGVKFEIKTEGFYRLTRAELQAAGFNVNASTNFWQLYKNGVQQSIIVDSNDQYIEFYAKAPENLLETDYDTFYLIVGADAGKRIGTRTVRPVGGNLPAQTFYNLQTTEQNLYYITDILNGDASNFFGSIITANPTNINFSVKGIDTRVGKTDLFLRLQGLSQSPHTVSFRINGIEMGTVSGNGRESMFIEFAFATRLLNEGNNVLQLASVGPSQSYTLFDSISVDLQRKYVADQNQLSFVTNDQQASDIRGFTNNSIRVFDTTAEGDIKLLVNNAIYEENGLYTVNIPAFQKRDYFALTSDAIKQVTTLRQNNPTSLATTAHNGKVVIITHKNWMTEANAWAMYRQSGGMTVEVVDVEDIYDAFGYGRLSAKSITNFLSYAKNNWQTPPDYVLILGDATTDARNYINGAASNFVPTRLVDTIYMETGSDDALTDFNNDGLAEISIGRIPARTPADVTQMLNKVTTFEQTVGQAFDRGALCASDAPVGYDFIALCNRLMNELPTSIPKTFINRNDANSGSLLLQSLNSGKYLVNYSGHGNQSVWANASFFSSTTASGLTNGNNLSIFNMLSCLNGYFIDINTSALGEQLLKAPNGGAVSTWASSSLTTPDVQETMARRFYGQINAGNMTRLGDLINDSKSVVQGGRDVKLSWVLLGDPALKVR